MPINVNKLFVFALLAMSLLLGGCSGGEERQVKYFAKATQLFENKDFEKSRIEVKNVLQINSNHVAGRYLLSLLHEQEKNWQQMFANLSLVVELDPRHVDARFKLAKMFLANRGYDKAHEQVDRILAQDPEYMDALALRADIHFRNGQHDEAIKAAQEVLNKQPGHVGAISVLSQIYSEQDPELALAVIGDGIKLQTGDASLKLLQIGLLVKQSRPDEAIRGYRQLIDQFPDNLFYQYRFVRYLEQTHRIDEAETILRNIVNARSGNIELKLWLAQFLANNRNAELAETTLKGFISQQPKRYELRFGLGKLYAGLKRHADAEGVYQAIISLDDKGADALLARNYLIELALMANDTAQAEQMLAEVFEIEQENKEALLTRGRMSLKNNDTESATADLRTVLRNAPKSTAALKLLAQAHETDGARNLALDNYLQVLQIDPVDNSATYHAARLSFADGDYEAAEHMLVMLARRQPDNPEVIRKLVATYGQQDRWPQANREAEKLIKEEKTAALGHYLKGRILFDQNDDLAAIISLQQSLLHKPGAVEALQYLSKAFERNGQPEKALKFVTNHVEHYPKHAHALELLGNLQKQSGGLDKAIESYMSVIEMAPQRGSAYQRLASLYASQGQWDKALAVYDQSITNNPVDSGLLMALAALHSRMGSFEAAIDVYEQVLVLDPGHMNAANNLSSLLVDYRLSAETLARARALSEPLLARNRSPVFLDTLGWVHYKLGNTSQAVNLLGEAVQLGGDSATHHYHLGMAYFTNNQRSLAKQQLTLALQDENDTYVGREEAELTMKLL